MRYLGDSPSDLQKRKAMKRAVLRTEHAVGDHLLAEKNFGKVATGYRGVVRNSWVDIGLIQVNEERLDATNTIRLKPANNLTKVLGWRDPYDGLKVMEMGRSTGLIFGKVSGKAWKGRIVHGQKRILTDEWSITSHAEGHQTDDRHMDIYRNFMAADDSGSVICGRPEPGPGRDPTIAVVGLMFGGQVLGEVAKDFTLFMPASTVAYALHQLTGRYLVPGPAQNAQSRTIPPLHFDEVTLNPEEP